MVTTTLSSREFNQDTSRAKTAARQGPVIITDRGEPSHVLLTFQDYRKLTETEANIVDLLSHPASADIEFDPPKLDGEWFRPADLS